MPRRQPRKADKNPLHDSALRIGDVHIGRSFILFNIYSGIIERGRFLSLPFVEEDGYLLQVHTSESRLGLGPAFLTDMGIAPRWGYHRYSSWNQSNFTIDARKEHLLPAPFGVGYPYEDDFIDDLDDFYWGQHIARSF